MRNSGFLGFWTMVSRFSPNLKTDFWKVFLFETIDVDSWKFFLKTIYEKQFIFGILKKFDNWKIVLPYTLYRLFGNKVFVFLFCQPEVIEKTFLRKQFRRFAGKCFFLFCRQGMIAKHFEKWKHFCECNFGARSAPRKNSEIFTVFDLKSRGNRRREIFLKNKNNFWK